MQNVLKKNKEDKDRKIQNLKTKYVTNINVVKNNQNINRH